MIDPDALERKQKIKDMEKRLDDADFDSSHRHLQIEFQDKETDMSEFDFYLLNQLPSQEIQATVEMIDSQTQHFEPSHWDQGTQTPHYVPETELIGIARKIRAVEFNFQLQKVKRSQSF